MEGKEKRYEEIRLNIISPISLRIKSVNDKIKQIESNEYSVLSINSYTDEHSIIYGFYYR